MCCFMSFSILVIAVFLMFNIPMQLMLGILLGSSLYLKKIILLFVSEVAFLLVDAASWLYSFSAYYLPKEWYLGASEGLFFF